MAGVPGTPTWSVKRHENDCLERKEPLKQAVLPLAEEEGNIKRFPGPLKIQGHNQLVSEMRAKAGERQNGTGDGTGGTTDDWLASPLAKRGNSGSRRER